MRKLVRLSQCSSSSSYCRCCSNDYDGGGGSGGSGNNGSFMCVLRSSHIPSHHHQHEQQQQQQQQHDQHLLGPRSLARLLCLRAQSGRRKKTNLISRLCIQVDLVHPLEGSSSIMSLLRLQSSSFCH